MNSRTKKPPPTSILRSYHQKQKNKKVKKYLRGDFKKHQPARTKLIKTKWKKTSGVTWEQAEDREECRRIVVETKNLLRFK